MRELDTRVVPIEHIEVAYARHRPPAERSPVPRAGDRVFYRHTEWDEQVTPARVLWVQNLNDRADPQLWHTVRDAYGQVILDDGVPRQVPLADPWPQVRLSTVYGELLTWESRVRGSPGWLPLDWESRPVRLPWELTMHPHPPLNVPLDQLRPPT